MPNGTYGGVRGKETKVGQKTFVSRPTRFTLLPLQQSRFDFCGGVNKVDASSAMGRRLLRYAKEETATEGVTVSWLCLLRLLHKGASLCCFRDSASVTYGGMLPSDLTLSALRFILSVKSRQSCKQDCETVDFCNSLLFCWIGA